MCSIGNGASRLQTLVSERDALTTRPPLCASKLKQIQHFLIKHMISELYTA